MLKYLGVDVIEYSYLPPSRIRKICRELEKDILDHPNSDNRKKISVLMFFRKKMDYKKPKLKVIKNDH